MDKKDNKTILEIKEKGWVLPLGSLNLITGIPNI